MRDRYHRVRVARVIRETAEAHSLVLSVPPELSDTFRYLPGQYLTVRVPHAAGSVARCYSLCTSPFDGDPPTVTVKRTRGGHVSNWICDRVEAGTELDVMAPAGAFTPPALDADLLLFAGGSGITPVMSILRAALSEGDGRVVLVYANRDAASVIFAAALADLAARYPDRLRVHHWYDVDAGPPTADALRDLVEPYAGYETFVCGPEPYMAVVEKALATLAVPVDRIHIERFEAGPAEPADSAAATVEVTMDGQTHRYPWPAGTRLLDVLVERGLSAPFSCRQGTCASCACRITAGEVDLLHNEVLEDEDFADGYILACQAVARTPEVSVTYD
jgi:3-ketosteroid 9alpha-monooxygenase subunit B